MKRELIAVVLVFVLLLSGGWAWAQASKGQKGGTVYDYALTAIDGSPMPLANFKGKVILLVNTASFCGFTPQYAGLQKLQSLYGRQGITDIGVPSGNILVQE